MGGGDRSIVLRRKPFVDALDEFAKVLDAISNGQMGSHLLTNTKKLRACKHNETEDSYREWVLDEIHIQENENNGYKGYLDSSAFMANLWIGWTLEFFRNVCASCTGSGDAAQ